ncbi:hypothetical protein [Arenicella xantha]|uniref:Secreted protein n=1 Tax=Arenicella xantha TaxID=644221 RepID=A0A395JFP0_9GAMM|nr:hypothetical protein [Arenicella xantha]RBP48623.1 hypothetical protein DFR28_106110 [Arenicella xantha]
MLVREIYKAILWPTVLCLLTFSTGNSQAQENDILDFISAIVAGLKPDAPTGPPPPPTPAGSVDIQENYVQTGYFLAGQVFNHTESNIENLRLVIHDLAGNRLDFIWEHSAKINRRIFQPGDSACFEISLFELKDRRLLAEEVSIAGVEFDFTDREKPNAWITNLRISRSSSSSVKFEGTGNVGASGLSGGSILSTSFDANGDVASCEKSEFSQGFFQPNTYFSFRVFDNHRFDEAVSFDVSLDGVPTQ